MRKMIKSGSFIIGKYPNGTNIIWRGKPVYKIIDGVKVKVGNHPSEPRLCPDCGTDISLAKGPAYRCRDCQMTKQRRKPRQQACTSIVAIAVKAEILPKLDGSIKCTDCDKPAYSYDHRDYMKPLEVDPVCQGCNTRRGTALNHDYL